MGKKFTMGLTIRDLYLFSSKEDWDLEDDHASSLLQGLANRGVLCQPRRLPIDAGQNYREVTGESANLLVKEVQAGGISVYYDPSKNILLPSSLLQQSAALDDPKFPFR
jgi:hypothetical protein